MKLLDISDIPELTRDNVHISDKPQLIEKINKLITGGHTRLQIVTDFDHTLTRHKLDNGNIVLTSFGMFRECPSIPQHYKDEDTRLSGIYKPIEADPHMTVEEKTKHMIDWYHAAHALLKGVKLPRDELAESGNKMKECFSGFPENTVTERSFPAETALKFTALSWCFVKNNLGTFIFTNRGSNKHLVLIRLGVRELVAWSGAHAVPMLVFSAGLGQSVVAALGAAALLLPNVKVVSNFLAVDANDCITGIHGEVIHTYNKNEAAIKNTEYYELVRSRDNVLLMGDNIGDAGMAQGMDHCDTVVKVGFLGHGIANLPNYLKHFDIVLVDDNSVDLVNAILKLVL